MEELHEKVQNVEFTPAPEHHHQIDDGCSRNSRALVAALAAGVLAGAAAVYLASSRKRARGLAARASGQFHAGGPVRGIRQVLR